ncbi:pinensin family lanthipeptide [Roseivirga sp. BDSF3-8]|uniref:pinensin family lanthipeptide n=1 Tax=Roseivirga sp. BDSF3-8 TaxID=3241598 RepID=UPI003531CC02
MKKRLSLEELEVTSFVTEFSPEQTHLFAGGATATCLGSGCPEYCNTLRGTKCITDKEPVEPIEEPVPVTVVGA